ncbi:MAG: phosphatase PAP2 family protein [Calditrichia bacterium]
MALLKYYQTISYTFIQSFLLAGFLCAGIQAQSADARLLRSIHEGYEPKSTEADLLEAYTNSLYGTLPLTPILLYASGYFKGDAQLKKDAVQFVVTQIANYGITYSLKFSVNRKRPYLTHDWVNTDIREIDSSFPSAHSSGTVALAAFLHFRYQKRWLTITGYSYAGAMMLARMRQGVHYPADVFAGAAIGVFSGWLVNRAMRRHSPPLSIGWLPATSNSSSRLTATLRF